MPSNYTNGAETVACVLTRGWREILVLEAAMLHLYLQPSPAWTRCPAAGVSERKLNRRRAVECNVLAMPNQHGLCRGQLGTPVG